MRSATTIARDLIDLALEYARYARLAGGLQTYQLDDHSVPVLPAAVHDALCDSDEAFLDDPEAGVVICDQCRLGVER